MSKYYPSLFQPKEIKGLQLKSKMFTLKNLFTYDLNL